MQVPGVLAGGRAVGQRVKEDWLPGWVAAEVQLLLSVFTAGRSNTDLHDPGEHCHRSTCHDKAGFEPLEYDGLAFDRNP